MDQDLILQIPANYYFDLSLRFDLEQRLIDKMRAYNILYDEDVGGNAYFQIFTRDVNGLFLEVVQRNGYTGFGAANAPVRMAAQARDYEELQNFIAEVQAR
jgi:4-hydroxyphenylpyruvate dioxygenase